MLMIPRCVFRSAFFLLFCLLCAAGPAAAQSIDYPADGSPLRNTDVIVPSQNIPGSLFPDPPSDNKVTVSGGTVPGVVAGGLSDGGGARDNRVTVSGGTMGQVVGGYSDTGTAAGNSVTVSGGAMGEIAGGYSFSSATVSGNSVNLSGGGVSGRVIGGSSDAGAVSGNSVTVTSGALDNIPFIYGGASASGDVSNNRVTVSGGSLGFSDLVGGDSGSGAVSGNTVSVTGGYIGWNVRGGKSLFGDASGNRVTVSGGAIDMSVYGGDSGTGVVSGNRVTVDGGGIDGDVHGGRSFSGSVSDNSVTVGGNALIQGMVYGGSNTFGAVSGNSVSISGGRINSHVYGGRSDTGAVSGNTVAISGGALDVSQSALKVYGGYSDSGPVTGNSVTVSGAAQDNIYAIYGGWSSSGAASGNSVTVDGASLAWAEVTGGYSAVGNATGNSVTVNGGTIGWGVVGGISSVGEATGNSAVIRGGTIYLGVLGGYSDSGDVTGNSVTVSGGSIDGGVFGGWSMSGNATGNTVTLSGTPDLGTSAVYGGFAEVVGTDVFSGNTLNVDGFRGRVVGVHNFQSYNFTPAAGAKSMITVTGNTPTDLTGTTVAIGGAAAGGGKALVPGQEVVLISKTTGRPLVMATAPVTQGFSLEYLFDLEADSALRATVTGASVNPRTKALSEGRVAGHAFLNQGSDLIAGPGIHAALLSTRRQGAGIAPFIAGSGGASRYNTGSHADVRGFSMLTGLAWRAPLDEKRAGALLLGGFFEAGWGGYDTRNGFSGFASVSGDGNVNYYGGGVLGRYGAPCGAYAEASFRAGRVNADFSSDDLRDPATGRKADYDTGSAYYGAHGGLGYVWKATDAINVDFSAKYIWTHQGADSVTAADDPVKFKAADSHRARAGARVSGAANDLITPYAGAYYEYEFDGKGRATTYGYSINAADLKGGTGIGELGLTVAPVKDSGLSLDLGVQGYTGTRQGVTGSFQLKWEF